MRRVEVSAAQWRQHHMYGWHGMHAPLFHARSHPVLCVLLLSVHGLNGIDVHDPV